ncbi:ABC transporter permease [Bacteroides sp. 224]|uniref:ABC transporter permease n=1 Tax=Bacteroides sp. 224 TaxID=2302936 RepID=UPI0013D2645F|nr:FtsX-like permease family protein [Bacteroides sp. 224]NDV64468.1 hypothetical protein [Bacteroides sp. 224]
MLYNYIKNAFRNIIRHKIQTTICVLGLTTGVLCFSVCSYYGRAMFRGDSCFSTYNRMAGLFTHYEGIPDGGNGIYKYHQAAGSVIDQFLELGFPEVEYVARYNTSTSANIELEISDTLSNEYRVRLFEGSRDFFKVYPPKVIEGTVFSFSERLDAALVTRSFVARLGLDNHSIVGKQLMVNSFRYMKFDQPKFCIIVGVIEDYPLWTNLQREIDVITRNDKASGDISLLMFPEVNVESINKRLQGKIFGGGDLREQTLEVQLYSDMRVRNPTAMYLSFIGFLVLFAGLINFLSFTVSSFLNRSKEISLRKILGATSKNLFGLLFTELCLLTLISFLLTVSLTESLISYILSILPYKVQADFSLDIKELMFHQGQYFICIIIICLLVALVNVWRIKNKKNVMVWIRNGNRHKLRNILLGVQLFICVAFLLATVGAILQSDYIKTQYNPYLTLKEQKQILFMSFENEHKLYDHADEIIHYIKNTNWVEKIAFYSADYTEYQSANGTTDLQLKGVSPEYFSIMNYPIELPLENKPYCYINHSLKDQLEKDSLLSGFRVKNKYYSVTGLINYKERNSYLTEVAFIPFWEKSPRTIYIKVKPEIDSEEIADSLTNYIKSFLPAGSYYEVTTLEKHNESLELVLLKILFLICVIVCLMITVLGIYSAITLDTQRRQKEVAIRKINGAVIKDIYLLFAKLYIRLFVIVSCLCVILGLAVCIKLSESFEMFNYKNPLFWIYALAIATFIIILTIASRIYLTSRQNPAETIKSE